MAKAIIATVKEENSRSLATAEERILLVERILDAREHPSDATDSLIRYREEQTMGGLSLLRVAETTSVLLAAMNAQPAASIETGEAETIALTATGAQALTISGQTTIVDGVTTQATGNRTLNLTIDDGVKAGATLLVKSKTAATETTIFGTAIDGPTITGEAGKTYTQKFTYDGTSFVADGTAVKID